MGTIDPTGKPVACGGASAVRASGCDLLPIPHRFANDEGALLGEELGEDG